MKAATPKRAGTAKRAATPQRAAAPKRVAAPQRVATKKRVVAPKRSAAPKRVTNPAAQRPALAKHTTGRPAVTRPEYPPLAARAAERPVRSRQAPATPTPPAFAAQRAHATPREELLFEIQRARATVRAAIQGLAAGTAEQPIAPGKWSIKEIVLHLSERDRVRLEEIARTLGGQARTWAGIEDPEMGVVNELHLAPLRAHSWDDAVRRMEQMREQLMRQLLDVPMEPDDVWRRGHPFADMMWGLPEHDRHHAAQIKHARIGGSTPVEA